MKKLLLVLCIFLGSSFAAHAAALNAICTEALVTSIECDPVNATNPLPVTPGGAAGLVGYPIGATAISNYVAGIAGATSATIPAAAGKFSYICGFTITATATAAAIGQATLLNTGLTTLGFQQQVFASPAASNLTETFSPCLPATAVNTAITVTSAAAGTGGATNVVVWGFQK